MKYCIEAGIFKQCLKAGSIKYIKLCKMKPRQILKMRDVAPPAKPQVVNAPDFVVALE